MYSSRYAPPLSLSPHGQFTRGRPKLVVLKRMMIEKQFWFKQKQTTERYLEEVPQVHEVSGEHELLRLGDEAVGHEAEVLHQLGGAVNAGVHVQLGASQQPQQQVVDLVEDHGGVGRQRQLSSRQVKRARGAEHLAEGVAGDEGDEEVRGRCRKQTQNQERSNHQASSEMSRILISLIYLHCVLCLLVSTVAESVSQIEIQLRDSVSCTCDDKVWFQLNSSA